MQENEINFLISLILDKGRIDYKNPLSRKEIETLLEKFGMREDYEKSEQLRQDSHWSDDMKQAKSYDAAADKLESEIVGKAKDILTKNGYDTPSLLSDAEKNAEIEKELHKLGLSKEDINSLLKEGGMEQAETSSGQKFDIIFNDTPETRKILEKNDIIYDKLTDGKGLKVNAKMFLKEGFDVEDTAKNRKLLEDNEISYMEKAAEERKLFVPLRAKKVATLIAGSLILGPVPAIALQIALNQTGILDKLMDKHLISIAQKQALDAGFTVKAMQKMNGKDIEQYIYKDLETGQVNKVNVNEVQLPKKYMGKELSPAQIHELKEGRVVEFVTKNGMNLAMRIDLKEPTGIRAMYKEMKTDRDYIDIPKKNSPDIDKLNYIALRGVKGVEDIYGTGMLNSNRDSFLRRFNLTDDFYKIKNTEASLKGLSGEPRDALLKEIGKGVESFKSKAVDLVFDFEHEEKKGRKI